MREATARIAMHTITNAFVVDAGKDGTSPICRTGERDMSSFKTYIEIPVTVDYHYQPFEAQTKTDPEVYAEVTVNVVEVALPEGSIRVGHYPDIQSYLDKSTMESIEQQCFEDQRKEHETKQAMKEDAADVYREDRRTG